MSNVPNPLTKDHMHRTPPNSQIQPSPCQGDIHRMLKGEEPPKQSRCSGLVQGLGAETRAVLHVDDNNVKPGLIKIGPIERQSPRECTDVSCSTERPRYAQGQRRSHRYDSKSRALGALRVELRLRRSSSCCIRWPTGTIELLLGGCLSCARRYWVRPSRMESSCELGGSRCIVFADEKES